MSFSNIFVGTFVHTTQLGHLDVLHDRVLVVDDLGFIEDICARDSPAGASYLARPEATITSLPPGSFILPTFCDLHLHAPQYLYLGTGLHLPLLEWLNEYAFKAEEQLDQDPNGLGRRVYTRLAERLIQAGTGAALLFGTIQEETNITLADAFQAAGVRGFIGKLSMDKSTRPSYVETSAESSLVSAASFIHRCQGLVAHIPKYRQLVEPVITPRFVPTCTDELLTGLGQLSTDLNVRVQSHLAEARDQVDWVKSERGVDDIDVFDRSNLLTSRTIQAHCTFLDSPSLARLKTAGTAVAHCPLSNVYFSSLPFPLREALDIGVRVGLGSDVAGGYTVDISTAMRQAVITSRTRESARKEAARQSFQGALSTGTSSLAIDWKEALYLATRGGAEALGLNTGQFLRGAPFDAQQINLVDPMSGQGLGQLDFFGPVDKVTLEFLEKWWCLGDSSNRSAVWIQGKKVL